MARSRIWRRKILSCDLHKNKLKLVSDGAEKLGISIIETREQNGSVFVPEYEGAADRVLCDVPCSGLGVIAKKPEIRHKDLTESARLPAIQADILEASAGYLKPGGVLVYSTCTIFPEENEHNVARFLASHPEFSAQDFAVGDIRSESGMLTLTPDEHGTDGFFIAKMRKV